MSHLLSEFITRDELAKELRISPRTLDAWVWKRQGPPRLKLGGRCYYKRQAVNEWLDTQASGAREAA